MNRYYDEFPRTGFPSQGEYNRTGIEWNASLFDDVLKPIAIKAEQKYLSPFALFAKLVCLRS